MAPPALPPSSGSLPFRLHESLPGPTPQKPVPRNPCRPDQFREGGQFRGSRQSGAGRIPARPPGPPAPAAELLSSLTWNGCNRGGCNRHRARNPAPSTHLGPLNTPSYPFSTLSKGGHTLGAPPVGRTCSCSHLCPSRVRRAREGASDPNDRSEKGFILFFAILQEGPWPRERIPLLPIPR